MKHGAVKDGCYPPEYQAWKAMKWRCNPKNKASRRYYFDKGIVVCSDWQGSFTSFRQHVGPMPSPGMQIDRIDGAKGYFPGNVRWATRNQQMANTKRARQVTINGRTECLSEWARISGIPLNVIVYRVRRRWPEGEILSTLKWKHRVGRCA